MQPEETYVHTPPSFQGPWAPCPKCGKVGPDDDPNIPPGAHVCSPVKPPPSLKSELWELVEGSLKEYQELPEFRERLTEILLNHAGE